MKEQTNLNETMQSQDEASEPGRSRIWTFLALLVFAVFLVLIVFFAVALFS